MAAACPESLDCVPSGLLDSVVNEHRKSHEVLTRPGFEKLQAVAAVVLKQPGVSLIERVAPESRQTTPCHAVKPRVEHRPHTVKPHPEGRSRKDVPQKITGSVVANAAPRPRLEDPTNFTHHLRLIRIRNRYGADHAIKCSRSQWHVFRLSQYHQQAAASAIRKRVHIDVQSDGHTSTFCELFKFLPIPAPDVDHERSGGKWRLCARQSVSVPSKCRRTNHGPILRRPIRQRQDFGQ